MNIDSMTAAARDALTASATGTIKIVEPTLAGAASFVPMAHAIVKVNGVPLKAGTDWTAGTSAAATATSLASAITTATATTLCTGAVDGTDNTLVVLTANTAGSAGNAIAISTTMPDYTFPSGPTLLGGASPVAGQLVYVSDDAKLNVYTTAWKEVTSAT